MNETEFVIRTVIYFRIVKFTGSEFEEGEMLCPDY